MKGSKLFKGLAIAALLFVLGCNTERKAQRKEDKLVSKITASRKALERVAPYVFDLFPQAIDTTFTFKKGMTDSSTIGETYFTDQSPFTEEGSQFDPPVLLYDTTGMEGEMMQRVVLRYQDRCNEAVKNAFDMGFDVAAKAIKNFKIPIKQPDTLLASIQDKRALKILGDSLVQKEKQRAEAIVKLGSSEESISTLRKYLLYGGIFIGVLFFVCGILVVKKFKLI